MRSDVLNTSSGKYDGKTRPTTIFDWDYISCSPPILSAVGNSATDVMADGDKGSMLWPGKGGQLYPSTVCYIGAFTAVGTIPNVDGAVPATDTNSTVAGLNMQMDSETAGNVGIEIVLGGSQLVQNQIRLLLERIQLLLMLHGITSTGLITMPV